MLSGSVLADRFEVDRIAGSGGMATVYRAIDRQTGMPVALKILSAHDSRESGRFAQEARLLAELSHPGIVGYIAHGVDTGGRCYLAMEWLEGESLADHLRQRRPSVQEVVTLVLRVAEALASAHAHGVVHRDLKPSNIYLVGDTLEQPKILDFGIARLAKSTHAATRTGMMLGTPGYMAPEQARGDRSIDERADIFALGCVLFEGLTGRPAFLGEHPMALLAKILLEESPRPSLHIDGVPAALDALCHRMLAKLPADRPGAAAEIIEALRAIDPAALGDEGEATADAALGQSEQRLLSVVLAGDEHKLDTNPTLHGNTDGSSAGPSTDERPTPPAGHKRWRGLHASSIDLERASEQLAELRAVARPFGGRLEMLADGSIVWVLQNTGVATDQAAQAARCALALRRALPRSPMAIATGRGEVTAQWSMGEVIDRAARLLFSLPAVRVIPDAEHPRGVRIDEVTAGLLDARFEVGGDAEGLQLRAERAELEVTRTLLGHPTECVGRDRELAALAGFYQECADEPRGRPVLVTALPGAGKSRLRYELLRRFAALPQPPEVWIARGDPLRAGSPFGLIAPALRRAAGILDGEDSSVRQQKLRARIARHVPASQLAFVTTFIGELSGVPFPDDAYSELAVARREPMVMGDYMRRAFEELLLAETAARPLVLVLEDLHWGDLPTVKLLDGALRVLTERPLLVLALGRPEVHELFPNLWADRACEEIRLGPLTRKAAERLVRQVLGDGVPAATVERLVSQADGNALFLEELIRAARESHDEALPETVIAMVQARLERLEPEARRVLRAASVFGEVFWGGGVAALLSDEEVSLVGDWLAELAKRELLTRRADRRFPNQVEYAFRHALVREAAYATLTDTDRTLGHRLAGTWLVEAGEVDALTLAEHFERGQEPDRAIEFYRRSAVQALEGNDLEQALVRCLRGIDCGAEGEVRGRLRLIELETHGWRGEWSQAEQSGTEAVRDLERGSPDWYMAMALSCEAASKLGNSPRLEALGEDLHDYASAGELLPEQATAMARAASQLYLQGKTRLADALVERLRPALAPLVDRPAHYGWVRDAFAVKALYTGDLGGYLTNKLEVVDAFARAGQKRSEVIQRVRLGYACLEIGDYARSVAELEAALAEANALGLYQAQALAKHNLGLSLSRLGRHEEAERLETEAIASFRAQGDQRLERAARLYLGEILLAAGNTEGAATHMEYVEQMTPEQNPVRAYALGQLARARLRQGRPADALALARAAMQLFDALGGMDEGESLLRLVLAEAEAAAGNVAAARATLASARERLMARADRIADPHLRETFLRHVPENAETLAGAFLPTV